MGSTRQILGNSPNAKPMAGDLDLLVLSNSADDDIIDITRGLVKFFKAEDYKAKSFFGNIVSISFPSEYMDSNAQIDLMIAIPTASNTSFSYLRDLKFYSGEVYDENATLLIKGLHRTDLIRYVVRGVGLSMANQGFKAFKWNGKYETVDGLVAALQKKVNRMRKPKYKRGTQSLVNTLSKYKTMTWLKKLLIDVDTGYIKNRYQIGRHTGHPIDVLRGLAFDEVDLSGQEWTAILSAGLGLSEDDIQFRVQTFDGVLDVLSEANLSEKTLVHIFKGYKHELSFKKAKNFWSDELEQKIIGKLPTLKGRL